MNKSMTGPEIRRFDNIDFLKSIAIYMVIFYHFNNISDDIFKGGFLRYFNFYIKSIFSICVPLFFFVNGLLLLNKPHFNLKEHVVKTIKIILLTVVWVIITTVVLSYLLNEPTGISEIKRSLLYLKPNWTGHLWFLGTLVVIYIFFPLIYSVYHSDYKIFRFFLVCVMLFTFGNTLLSNVLITAAFLTNKFKHTNFLIDYTILFNPFNGIYGYAIGYFMLGGVIVRYSHLLKNTKIKLLALLIIPFSMLCLFLYAIIMSNKLNKIWDIIWHGYDTVFTLINVIAIYTITLNFKPVRLPGKLISTIGQNSLGIYLVHIIIGNSIKPFYMQMEASDWLVCNFMLGFVILILSLLVTLLLKKIPLLKSLVII